MKRISLLLSTAIIGAATLFSSCHKDDEFSPTRSLMATWTLKSISVDNGNKNLDKKEMSDTFNIPAEIGSVTFNSDYTGVFTQQYGNYYSFPTIFGNGVFHWKMERQQEITITKQGSNPISTKLIFIDYNHIAVLDNNEYLPYGQSFWTFYERKK
jgi:hypothetical protein